MKFNYFIYNLGASAKSISAGIIVSCDYVRVFLAFEWEHQPLEPSYLKSLMDLNEVWIMRHFDSSFAMSMQAEHSRIFLEGFETQLGLTAECHLHLDLYLTIQFMICLI